MKQNWRDARSCQNGEHLLWQLEMEQFSPREAVIGEAIIDSMVANETMSGRDGVTVRALPHDRLRELLRAHGVLRAR